MSINHHITIVKPSLNHVKPSVYISLQHFTIHSTIILIIHSTISINSPSLDHQFTTIRPSKDCVALQCHAAKLPKACPPSFRRRARETVGKCSAWRPGSSYWDTNDWSHKGWSWLGPDWAIPQGGPITPIIESQSHWLPRLREKSF